MNFNFELIIFCLMVSCGLIALIDILFFAKKRTDPNDIPILFDYARSFFPVLLFVFFIRSFLYEPFRIPSGSLKPTLQVGDFITVNKYIYGLRLPIIRKKIASISAIKRGDILVFHYPLDTSIYYIKRVIGLPGDRISYINKKLIVNGQHMTQIFVKPDTDETEGPETFHWKVDNYRENLSGVVHNIFINPNRSADDFENRVVPEGEYFVMGDNRDNSEDSRSWGFVPDRDVVGKASAIWMSWNASNVPLMHKIRWDRIGRMIH